MENQTLEESANKIYHNIKNSYPTIPNDTNWIQGFVEGAKYQQERSEEDLKEAFSMGRNGKTIEDFNRKFKKNKI